MKMKKLTGTATFLALLLSVLIAGPVSAASTIADNDISFWVKDALRHDERIDAALINVKTEKGITTLSGTVTTLAAKRFADLEAKKIKGVIGVLNEIAVTPTQHSDASIRNAVQRRILNSAVIETKELGVACHEGRVTLAGTVASYAEKREAGILASEVMGVKEVKNEIIVEWTGMRSDQEIKDDALAVLARNVYLSGLPITIVVRDGVVTLSGTVGSEYEKELARTQVRWVAQVKDVKNELKVEWRENRGTRNQPPRPTDEAIQKAVREELNQDGRIDASNITIKISSGEVKLVGTVASHYQRRIAAQDAADVVGVSWVMNNLFAQEDSRVDWAVRNDVEFNLKTDALIEGYDIGVRVNDGVVSLSGDVGSEYEKFHATDVVARIRGVKDVINRINVQRVVRKQDADLEKDIRERLTWNWTTCKVGNRISVRVKNGVAELTGDVDTWAERREADRVAFHTEGIREVDNWLTVKGQDYPWDEHHYKQSSHLSLDPDIYYYFPY
jgi:osmotically-inducible protein OsmY